MRKLAYLPNLITASRLIILPLFYFEYPGMFSLALVIYMGVSDILDGQIARRLGIVSEFGMRFDELSDKVVTWTMLIVIGTVTDRQVILWLILLVIRDTAVTILRRRRTIPPSPYGKAKTVLLFVGAGAYCIGAVLLGRVMIALSILMAYLSARGYLKRVTT